MVSDGLIIVAFAPVGAAPIGKGGGKTGIETDCFVSVFDSFVVLVLFMPHSASQTISKSITLS